MDDPSELFRRYFVNTVFDSTFVVLGILAGAAFVPEANVEVALGTIFAACLAIGISTGVSVHEAELAEGEIRLKKIEQAMLSPVGESDVGRRIRGTGRAKALVNFLAPLFVALITGTPILLFEFGVVQDFAFAALVSGSLGIAIIFVTGYYLGIVSGRRPWWKALRMAGIAILTFVVLVLVERAV